MSVAAGVKLSNPQAVGICAETVTRTSANTKRAIHAGPCSNRCSHQRHAP